MEKDKRIGKAYLLAFFTVFCWGTTFVSTKVLLESYTPIEILFFRFVIGYVALTIMSPKPLKYKGMKEEMLFIGAGLTGITLYFLLENIALTLTLVSNVGIICSVAPMVTAFVVSRFYKTEKPGKQFYLGFLASITGIIIISLRGQAELAINPLGDFLAFGACVVWAFYSVFMKKISALDYNTIKVTRKNFRYGILFMFPALLFMDFRFGFERLADPVNLLNILYLGFGASALCFVTWNLALKIIGPIKTSVFIYLVPVITIAASAIVLGETITPLVAVGAALTIFGLYLSQRKGKAAEKESDEEKEKRADRGLEDSKAALVDAAESGNLEADRGDTVDESDVIHKN